MIVKVIYDKILRRMREDTGYATNGELDSLHITGPLDVEGPVTLRAGDPGEGKVLTSDAGGLISWVAKLWTETNGNIHRTDGNVGVGEPLPTAKLHTNGTLKHAALAQGSKENILYIDPITKEVAEAPISIDNLNDASSDDSSVFIGKDSGINDSLTSNKNTGVGAESLKGNTSGIENTTVGTHSLESNTSGDSNAAVGYMAGKFAKDATANTTGSNNTFLGSRTEPLSNGDVNETAIGYRAIGAGSNTVTIGNDDVERTILKGLVEATRLLITTDTQPIYGQVWTAGGTNGEGYWNSPDITWYKDGDDVVYDAGAAEIRGTAATGTTQDLLRLKNKSTTGTGRTAIKFSTSYSSDSAVRLSADSSGTLYIESEINGVFSDKVSVDRAGAVKILNDLEVVDDLKLPKGAGEGRSLICTGNDGGTVWSETWNFTPSTDTLSTTHKVKIGDNLPGFLDIMGLDVTGLTGTGRLSVSEGVLAATDPSAVAVIDGISADANSGKGILLPRLTESFREAIPSPADGLIVYQTNGLEGLYSYIDGQWEQFNIVKYSDPVIHYEMDPQTSDFADGTSLSTSSMNTAWGQNAAPPLVGIQYTIISGSHEFKHPNLVGIHVGAGGKIQFTFTGLDTSTQYRLEVDCSSAVDGSSGITGLLDGAEESITVVINSSATVPEAAIYLFTPTATEITFYVDGIANSYISDIRLTSVVDLSTIQLWSVSGDDIVRVNGNVGIGTDSPTAKLDVVGAIKSSKFFSLVDSNSVGYESKRVNNTDDTYPVILRASGDNYCGGIRSIDGYVGNIHILTGNAASMTDLTIALSLLGNGHVGIGGRDPTVPLELFDSSVNENKVVLRLTNTAPSAIARLSIDMGSNTAPVGQRTSARISSQVGSGYAVPKLYLEVADNTGTLHDRLVIDKDGLVTLDTAIKVVDATISYDNITHDPIYVSGQTGLDDLSSSGTYTGGSNSDFVVRINSTGTPDTVQWGESGGVLSTPVDITGAPQLMQNGVSFTFATTSGHTVNDEWVINVGEELEIDRPIHVGGTGKFDGDLTVVGDLKSYSLVGVREGIKFSGGATIATDETTIKFAVGGTAVTHTFRSDGPIEVSTPNYETLVTNDNYIPNKKYVDDAVSGGSGNVSPGTSEGQTLLWSVGTSDYRPQDNLKFTGGNSLSVGRSLIPTTGSDRVAINFGAGGSLIGTTSNVDAVLTQNTYYNNGYKYLTPDNGGAARLALDDGRFTFSTAPQGVKDSSISFSSKFMIDELGGITSYANFSVRQDFEVLGEVKLSGYTELGDDNTPAIKIAKFTGTMGANGGDIVSFTHGLISNKIIAITALVVVDPSIDVLVPPGWEAGLGYSYNVWNSRDSIFLSNSIGDSQDIVGKSYKVVITHEK